MSGVTHLKALQAVEMAIRTGSLKAAGDELGITPAAVGQRIRALEDYLDTELLLRGRARIAPTAELNHALPDLQTAFAAMERVSETLDFQRSAEIHMVADPDWAELWLLPRLSAYRERNPNISFCINGEGDVPLRLGAADIHVDTNEANTQSDTDEVLYTDRLLPVGSRENTARIADSPSETRLDGFPLLHLHSREGHSFRPGWAEWIATFGHRSTDPNRGMRYWHMRHALNGVRSNAGLLICNLSFVLHDLAEDKIQLPFPVKESLSAPEPYRMHIRPEALRRPQIRHFCEWLRHQAQETSARIADMTH
ncbi:LysR substrate-binding domain-containing protein [Fodinicurvata halophila]|uniref:LysR substrate-binding domain-containing protein n=1 Tax=Fodinicurvata halophila TaxID=1419723 RepID=A0ABV8UPK5_9PROT